MLNNSYFSSKFQSQNMQALSVYCSSNLGTNESYGQIAKSVGAFLAKNKITLVYGGANVGLMRLTAEACLENKGKAIGVITHFLAKKHLTQEGLYKMHYVDTMQERKALMSDLSDGFIILPGGCGTMEEFFEVFTAAQLGLHSKPIAIINTDGYYDHLKGLFDQMVKSKMMLEPHVKMIGYFENIDDAYEFMSNYKAPVIEKWIDDIKEANGHDML